MNKQSVSVNKPAMHKFKSIVTVKCNVAMGWKLFKAHKFINKIISKSSTGIRVQTQPSKN